MKTKSLVLMVMCMLIVVGLTGCPPKAPLTVLFTNGTPNVDVTATRTINSCEGVAIKAQPGWELIDLQYTPALSEEKHWDGWYPFCWGHIDDRWEVLAEMIPFGLGLLAIIDGNDNGANGNVTIDPIPINESRKKVAATYSDGNAIIVLTINNPCFTDGGEGEGEGDTFVLTKEVSPVGAGSFTTNPNPSGGTYEAGTTVIVVATANSGFVFSHWEVIVDGDTTVGTTDPTAQVIMDSHLTLRAVFTPTGTTTVTLCANVNGSGTVTGGGPYSTGATATVQAFPGNGWTFTGWSGDLSGSTNPTTVVMNSNKNITANFTQTAPPTGIAKITYALSGSSFTEALDKQGNNLFDLLAQPPADANSRTIARLGTLFMLDSELNKFRDGAPGSAIALDGVNPALTYRAVPYVIFVGDNTKYFFDTSKVSGYVVSRLLGFASDGQNWAFRFNG